MGECKDLEERYEQLPTVKFIRFMDSMMDKLNGSVYDGYAVPFDLKSTLSRNGLDPFLKVMALSPTYRRHYKLVLVLRSVIEDMYSAEDLKKNPLYQSFLETISNYENSFWDEDEAMEQIERNASYG